MPGQYLAVDPKGRAVMIAAVEKGKLVYVLNRDSAANLTISSPLEANKSQTLCFGLCALDVGFDNPLFAAIELSYADADADPTGQAAASATKHLTLYLLNLGLNTVERFWSEPCDNGANMLVPVPGAWDSAGNGISGPGGVLICAENFVSYRAVGHPEVTALLPRRADLPGDRGTLVTSATTRRTREGFFFLLQTEYGDIYKATLVFAGDKVSDLQIQYFDTIPTATSMTILRAGFIFASSEWGNHGFYQLTGTGPEELAQAEGLSCASTLTETADGFTPVFFTPRPLKHLLLLDEPLSMAPICSMLTDVRSSAAPHTEAGVIFAALGAGSRSRLAFLRPGVSTTELAVSPLPAPPTCVWTVRKRASDAEDAYIVVSFVNATVVLAVSGAVEEVHDSGFQADAPSLAVGVLVDDSLVQVTPSSMRRVKPGDKRVTEWQPPGRKSITKVALNTRQVVLALSGGDLIAFELDISTGLLQEVGRRETGGDVACMDVAPVPEGRLRSRFLALGAYDGTVRVLSLDPDECLNVLSMQATGASPESLLLLDLNEPMNAAAAAQAAAAGETSSSDGGGLYLAAGLASGVLQRTEVDRVTGQLSDTRKRLLGTKPPKLCCVSLNGRRALLALSSRSWLGYADAGRFALAPLSYDSLTSGASLVNDTVGEAVVATAGDGTLRVFSIDRPGGNALSASTIALRYTPRALVYHPTKAVLAVVEADLGIVPPPPGATSDTPGAGAAGGGDVMAVDGADDAAAAGAGQQWSTAEQCGHSRGTTWASCVRLVDTRRQATSCVLDLSPGEAAMCACCVQFPNYPEVLLAVGIATSLVFSPRSSTGGAICLYRFLPEGQLELLQRTALDTAPTAMTHLKGGRLLVGLGRLLRLYDLGKKKLLRKCELADFPNAIVCLQSAGDRVYAGDMQESVHFVRYKADDNALYIFADDTAPRWITAQCPLDYDTLAGGDKFGNLVVVRLPADASEEVEEDPSGGRMYAAPGSGAGPVGAAHKLDTLAVFHVGAPCRALCRATLQAGGSEVMLYATVLGGIGALLPFRSREDVDFAQQLEMHMRQEAPPLSGRDHLAYRGSYFPVKNVVDADLCEQFARLPSFVQKRIADDMERTPSEVVRKLEDLRSLVV